MPPPEQSPGTLWIVATPIGSLGDLAPRAVEVLRSVDVVLAEDTRRARSLLSHYGIAAGRRLRSLHEHNEERQVAALLEVLVDGRSVALVSDAGTPVLSDPGYRLVRGARAAELPVASVPGASSFTAALAAAGQPPLPALLCGFLPARTGPRRRRIAELAGSPWTLVVLLSPHRLRGELDDLADLLGGDRPATLLAEISKLHERAVWGDLGTLAGHAEAGKPRGEYVLVVGPAVPAAESPCSDDEVRAAYRRALCDGLPRSEALRAAARRCGRSRREVWQAVASSGGGDDDSEDGH